MKDFTTSNSSCRTDDIVVHPIPDELVPNMNYCIWSEHFQLDSGFIGASTKECLGDLTLPQLFYDMSSLHCPELAQRRALQYF